jgi:hypothetical protein
MSDITETSPQSSAVIQPAPHMDGEGLACFKEALASSRCYLEYGAGGSTVYAATVAKIPSIISVESDGAWKAKVWESIKDSQSRVHIEHWDIGEVGDWGSPKTSDKIGNYWGYMARPWHIAKTQTLVPDTVLVDGRFRVASFLFSLLKARIGTTILFDDYLDRPGYFPVEEFCPLAAKHGRMGVFSVSRNFAVADICEKIARYSIDPF